VLFKLFFAKEYPTNIKHSKYNFNEKKSNFLEKIVRYEKLSKFEQDFELVSRIVTLNLLTRKSTDKNTTWK
jgi:Tfp pilus assembly protein PilO